MEKKSKLIMANMNNKKKFWRFSGNEEKYINEILRGLNLKINHFLKDSKINFLICTMLNIQFV